MKYMKNVNSIWVLLCVFLMASCEKDDNHAPETKDSVNRWVYKMMKENYLWYGEIPKEAQLDFNAEADDFFMSLLSDQDGKDLSDGHHSYSTVEKATPVKSIPASDDSYGFDFATTEVQSGNKVYKAAVVIYVLKNSPAEEAGLRRGDWIIGVNGTEGTISAYEMLRKGGGTTFVVAKYDQQKEGLVYDREVDIAPSRGVEDTPFLKDSIYTYGNKRIGYLMYNHFSSGPDGYKDTEYNLYMQSLFEKFKSRGVNEFVLDLRYNGGGVTTAAQLLASLLAPKEALGKTFAIFEYNDRQEKNNKSESFLHTAEVQAANLNLKRLYVLTGSTTASSSELVINALKPYLGDANVRLIGLQTFGKVVGMSIYDESEKYGWIFSPVTFHIYNSKREANYGDGFIPDVRINEFNYDLVDLGDTRDPLLGQAINEITGRSGLRSSGSLPPAVSLEIKYSPQPKLMDNMILVPVDR